MARKPKSEMDVLIETLEKGVASAKKIRELAQDPGGISELIDSLGGKPIENSKPLSKEAENVVRIMERAPKLAQEIHQYAAYLLRAKKSTLEEG
jgi:hypothetical protein